jgi:hypothetical protein
LGGQEFEIAVLEPYFCGCILLRVGTVEGDDFVGQVFWQCYILDGTGCETADAAVE